MTNRKICTIPVLIYIKAFHTIHFKMFPSKWQPKLLDKVLLFNYNLSNAFHISLPFRHYMPIAVFCLHSIVEVNNPTNHLSQLNYAILVNTSNIWCILSGNQYLLASGTRQLIWIDVGFGIRIYMYVRQMCVCAWLPLLRNNNYFTLLAHTTCGLLLRCIVATKNFVSN